MLEKITEIEIGNEKINYGDDETKREILKYLTNVKTVRSECGCYLQATVETLETGCLEYLSKVENLHELTMLKKVV